MRGEVVEVNGITQEEHEDYKGQTQRGKTKLMTKKVVSEKYKLYKRMDMENVEAKNIFKRHGMG